MKYFSSARYSRITQHAAARSPPAKQAFERLNTDRIDLYLLHWRGEIPLSETLDGFDALQREGDIRYWGVSNFDLPDMEDLLALGGTTVAANQVLYNLTRRGIEYDLLPWCQQRHIPIIAYSPIEQGRVLRHPVLQSIAAMHNATPAQVALAWVLRQDRIAAIPKASEPSHVRENFAALEVRLTQQDLNELDQAFPPPAEKVPLEMI